jgi:alginate O-acetyltransferase complex protein AlgI
MRDASTAPPDNRHGRDAEMLFSSMSFLEFFVAVWGVHWLLRLPRHRHYWLLAASMVFYGSWSWKFLGLLVVTGAVNYFLVTLMDKVRTDWLRYKVLILTLIANLAQLTIFKYADFFSTNLADLLTALGLHVTPVLLNLVLPLGISFYTFEFIAYAVDVYRRKTPVQRDPLHFALYTMFFPRLIAGPIVRPNEFFPQLNRPRKFSWLRTQIGLQFFIWGFFKKVCVGDPLALAIDPFYADPAAYSSMAAWLAVFGYSVQLYCDFSGYSDMAIGLAHMLGYRLPANFRLPYLAADIREFWQRWHLSLSRWIRDYVYIALGGNRVSYVRQLVNVIIVMVACGLWHGAQWTYVVWGVSHGVMLAVHRIVRWPNWMGVGVGKLFSIGCTFLLIALTSALFRSESLHSAWVMYGRLFLPTAGTLYTEPMLAVFALGLAAGLLMHLGSLELRWRNLERRLSPIVVGAGWAVFILIINVLIPLTTSSFIYFQF